MDSATNLIRATDKNSLALIDLLPTLCEDRDACAARPYVAVWTSVGDDVHVVHAATATERECMIAAHPTPPPSGTDPARAELTEGFLRDLLGGHHAAILEDVIRSRSTP